MKITFEDTPPPKDVTCMTHVHTPLTSSVIRTKQILRGSVVAAAVLVPNWTLTAAGPAPVDLRSTGHFAILAGAAVTTTGGGVINGDVGASPIDGASILIPPVQVNGIIYAVDASGTQAPNVKVDPVLLTAAKGDLTIAYNDAAGRTPVPTGDFLNPQGGNLGGLSLVPGLYKFTGTALITGADVTLTGGPDDVWIFQIAADLQVGSGINVILAGGARAKNIFWQVGTSAVIETSSVFKGTILADQSITMKTSSTMEGRALASSAGVTFNGTTGGLPGSALTDVNGSGCGTYDAGPEVPITADAAPIGQFFVMWSSDTAGLTYIADIFATTTTVKMPASSLTVTATYREAVPCVVTLVSNPVGVGELTVTPAQVFIGQTVRLSARPLDPAMYVFVRWEASALATLDNPFAAGSRVLIDGNATLTALFALASPIQKASVTLDNSKPTMEKATVSAVLPMTGGAPFTFDSTQDTLTALIDGKAFVMSTTTGVFKQKVAKKIYTFVSTSKTVPLVKLTLDLEKGLWSFSASKADKMSEVIDNSDGVGLFLVVSKKNDAAGVFRAYGGTPVMTETTSWKYAVKVNGAAASNSGLTVTSAQGKYLSDKVKGNKDQFRANGTIDAGSSFVFYPAYNTVAVSLDGVWSQKFITFDAITIEKKKIIKSKAVSEVDGSRSNIVVDLGKGLWSFNTTGGNLAGVTGLDGITIALDVGTYDGSALVKPYQKSALKYIAEK